MVASTIMRRVTSILIASLVFSALRMFAFPLAAAPHKNKKLSSTEIQAILHRAKKLTDIEAPGSPPFTLIANARYTLGDTTTVGTLGISWSAPDLFRREFSLPGFHEVELVSGGKLYRLRDTNYLPYAVRHWLTMIRVTENLYIGSHPHMLKPKDFPQQWAARPDVYCFRAKTFGEQNTLCLDRSTNEALSLDRKWGGKSESWSFKDYGSAGGIRFPRRIAVRDWLGFHGEIDIQKIAAVQKFAANEFTPLAGAVALPWCEHPAYRTSEAMRAISPVTVSDDSGDKAPVLAYELIGVDGRVKKYMQLYPQRGPLNDHQFRWLADSPTLEKTCGGKAIPYERFFSSNL